MTKTVVFVWKKTPGEYFIYDIPTGKICSIPFKKRNKRNTGYIFSFLFGFGAI